MRLRSTAVLIAALCGLLLTTGTAQAHGFDTHHVRGGHKMVISTHGDSFVLSTKQVEAGLVTTTLHNTDPDSPHQAQIARLLPGASAAGFGAAIAAHQPQKAIGMLAGFDGGPNVIAPGATQTTYQNLDAGHYLLLCFVPDPMTGAPHFAMGMFAGFDVVGATPEAAEAAELDDASATVAAVDEKRFVIPDTLESDSIIRFENRAATDVHEFTIGKLLPGKTPADVVAWAGSHQGPPPVEFKGGVGGVNPGEAAWFKLSLPDGNYVAFCQVPDDKTGVAHAADGMVSTFTIT